jgi:hypothetical protein
MLNVVAPLRLFLNTTKCLRQSKERFETIACQLNNWYGDGVNGYHDLSCNDRLPFICEQR